MEQIITHAEIIIALKYLSNFWTTLEIPLINCKVNLILAWFPICVIFSAAVANKGATFAIADTKCYVSVATLLTQDNVKLLNQLKSGFKRIVNWNKYQLKVSIERQNQ